MNDFCIFFSFFFSLSAGRLDESKNTTGTAKDYYLALILEAWISSIVYIRRTLDEVVAVQILASDRIWRGDS